MAALYSIGGKGNLVVGLTKLKMARRVLGTAAIVAIAAVAGAQQPAPQAGAAPETNSAANLKLPDNVTVFGNRMPSVVKASAIVNGEVITQTDIDQRLALMAIANGGAIPADQVDLLRQQVLTNLIDESLQIQAAKHEEIEITPADIDKTVERVAGNVKQTPDQMATYLKSRGSSIRSIRRQIEGEIAWRRLQSKKIESVVNVSDDEVKSVIDKLNASKGADEYRVGEIFLSASTANDAAAQENAGKIFAALQQGGSFVGYARQFSEASTKVVGGDLGWVRPEMLPDPLANAIRTMRPGQVTPPIKVPGGYSIIAVQDQRKVLTADPRNSVLTLKQVSVSFPKGTTRAQAEPLVARFSSASTSIGGCGNAEKVAAEFKGEVVESDQVKIRDLPPALQEMLAEMQIGQATRPFGSIEEGVRVLVLCGRDMVDPSVPTFEQMSNQMVEERVNLRARRYLRDLRRDAIIEFRA